MASYEKSATGKWSVRFRAFEDNTYKNKRLSGFKTKKEAEVAYHDYSTKHKPIMPSKISSFEEGIDAYFDYLEYEREVEESTYVTFESRFSKHLSPFLKTKNIKKFTEDDIREFKGNIQNYSFRYKTELFSLLGSFFKFLDKYYDTTLHKCWSRVPNFKNKKTKQQYIDFWDYEQYKTFIAYVDDEYWALVFDTLYWSGLRKSELFGLRVPKVDFRNNLFIIDNQTSYKTRNKTEKAYAEKLPKSSNSIREVLMPKSIIQRIEKTIDKKSTGFVFGRDNPIPPESLRRNFGYYISKANEHEDLPIITPHDLRHSHVSFIINQTEGGDLTKLYTIASRIGDTVEQVLKTYGHMFKSAQINLMKDIELAINNF